MNNLVCPRLPGDACFLFLFLFFLQPFTMKGSPLKSTLRKKRGMPCSFFFPPWNNTGPPRVCKKTDLRRLSAGLVGLQEGPSVPHGASCTPKCSDGYRATSEPMPCCWADFASWCCEKTTCLAATRSPSSALLPIFGGGFPY